jgi:signal recognition particle subunit SRP54
MADMMKQMGQKGGMLNKFLGRTGAGPSEAEMASMQSELAKLDPKALEQLPAELRDALPAGGAAPPKTLPGLGSGLSGLPKGLPGLGGFGGGLPKFPGFPGKKK